MSHANTKVITCGCRFNRCESAEIRTRLSLDPGRPVVVVNTCAVTKASEAKSRYAVRHAVRENPGSAIVVAGCWAELDPAGAAAIEGVSLVLGNEEKLDASHYLPGGGVHTGRVNMPTGFLSVAAPLTERRTAAYLKIQNGCDETCSYCVVRLVRGKGRSAPPEQVLQQVRNLAAGGAREIVLTGINIGRYGLDGGGTSLAELAAELGSLAGIRFRISSINPLDVTDELIAAISSSPAFCRHLHIPLQSGSDRILSLMERPYTAAQYHERVTAAALAMPGLGLGCDVMAGFPGETEADFLATAALLEELPFSYAHVFPYSARPGTPAAAMPGMLPEKVKKERTEHLKKIAAEKNLRFRQSLIGIPQQVLVEQKRSASGDLTGKSGSHIPMEFPGPDHLKGSLVTVEPAAIAGGSLSGRLC